MSSPLLRGSEKPAITRPFAGQMNSIASAAAAAAGAALGAGDAAAAGAGAGVGAGVAGAGFGAASPRCRSARFCSEYGRRSAFGPVFSPPSAAVAVPAAGAAGAVPSGRDSTSWRVRALPTCTPAAAGAADDGGAVTRSSWPTRIFDGSSRPFHCASSR